MLFPLLAEEPDIFAEELLIVHANEEPDTFDESAIAVVVPLHIVDEDGVAVTFGIGFTVTGTFKTELLHEFAEAVTEYEAVPEVDPEFVNVCAIGLPLPAVAPVTPV